MQRYRSHLPILLLLAAALTVGLLTVRDYGESWDEADIYDYAAYTLNAYARLPNIAGLEPFKTNLNLYGPAYYALAGLSAAMLTRLVPAWSQVDGWHVTYFLTFLAGVACFYLLLLRWVGRAAAAGAAALLLTQPLLWGHAFINPKDIPFLTLFTATILAGLTTIDHHAAGKRAGWLLALAALLAGITASLRVIGPLAAVIVAGYGVCRLRMQAGRLVPLYALTSLVVAFAAWPYLWSAPLGHFLESLQTMSQFPFATNILFRGQLFRADALPRSYFPTLLALQLTEPMLILLPAGLAAALLEWRSPAYREALVVFAAWFALPVVVIVATRSPLYDNGRQLYFVLPALFILAAIGLDRLFHIIRHPAAQAALLLAAALPGILVGARLHPYEYVYYNALTGGTGGAFRRYELDYWGVSIKEMSDYVNATAAPGSRVLVFGPQMVAARYMRADIEAAIPSENTSSEYQYVMMLTRENLDERRCKGAPVVHEVGRRGAIFAVLKSIPEGVTCK